MSVRLLAFAMGVLISAGCGLTRLQTARPVPRGETQTTFAASVIRMSDRDGFRVSGTVALPIDFMVRHGVSDSVDLGIRNFFALGLLADVKWNLLAPERPAALSISGGFGVAGDAGTVLHVPVTLNASCTFRSWFTPYAAVGYGAYWILDYHSEPQLGVTYAARTGTGDGLLMLHAGLELADINGRALLLEYSVGFPVVNDPGDSYGFGTNQFFSIGFHTGRSPRPYQ
jgi:hypothetical protein